MTCCINDDFPRVPTIIGGEASEKLKFKGEDTFVIDVSTPVTRRISAAKSALVSNRQLNARPFVGRYKYRSSLLIVNDGEGIGG